jgi:hypothetical protein
LGNRAGWYRFPSSPFTRVISGESPLPLHVLQD